MLFVGLERFVRFICTTLHPRWPLTNMCPRFVKFGSSTQLDCLICSKRQVLLVWIYLVDLTWAYRRDIYWLAFEWALEARPAHWCLHSGVREAFTAKSGIVWGTFLNQFAIRLQVSQGFAWWFLSAPAIRTKSGSTKCVVSGALLVIKLTALKWALKTSPFSQS